MSERRNALLVPAAPIFGLGDVVTYRDCHGRIQRGEVKAIEASWREISDRAPLIVYTLAHPTYAGRRFYTTDEDIFRHGVEREEPAPPSPPSAREGVPP